MRSHELTDAILKLLRQGKKQVQIAEELNIHYNTVYRHIKHLRQRQIHNDHLTLNKIDNRLDIELNTMTIPQLLTWRSQLVPHKVESKGEVLHKQEVPTLDTRHFTDNELAEIRQASRLIESARNTGKE